LSGIPLTRPTSKKQVVATDKEQTVMRVYMSRHRNMMGEMTPIVIETNLAWALPYWTNRRRHNPKIFWEIV
jgi:hypothetical protein